MYREKRKVHWEVKMTTKASLSGLL